MVQIPTDGRPTSWLFRKRNSGLLRTHPDGGFESGTSNFQVMFRLLSYSTTPPPFIMSTKTVKLLINLHSSQFTSWRGSGALKTIRSWTNRAHTEILARPNRTKWGRWSLCSYINLILRKESPKNYWLWRTLKQTFYHWSTLGYEDSASLSIASSIGILIKGLIGDMEYMK